MIATLTGGSVSYPRGMLESVTAHTSSEVIVGREADLATLRDALKRTRSAEPSTVRSSIRPAAGMRSIWVRLLKP